jgi:hypothetical protein
MEKRMERRKLLALQARDFQFVQMKENQKKKIQELNEQRDFDQRVKNEYELQE